MQRHTGLQQRLVASQGQHLSSPALRPGLCSVKRDKPQTEVQRENGSTYRKQCTTTVERVIMETGPGFW
jgi:hypothetical protein